MKNIISIFLVSFIFFACKKNTDKVVSKEETSPTATAQNWNQRFTGSYHGVWTSQTYSMGNYGTLNIKDTTLIIGLDQNILKNTTNLNNCSVIQFDSTNTATIYHGRLYIRNDSLLYNCLNGGMGAGVKETFNGKKL